MDLLDLLYFRMKDALARTDPDAADPVFTVADVYQRLIPYRAVRAELAIMELAQYEHALLRLLAGERGYLQLEAADARAELERELASPNPILGVYRDYASLPARLLGGAPAGDQEATGVQAPPEGGTAAEGGGRVDGPPASGSREAEPPGAAPEAAAPAEHAPAPAAAAAPGAEALRGGPSACVRCGGDLPDSPDLRFCPGCGADQHEARCVGCGAALRPEWNFCIRCGTARSGERRS